MGTEGRENGESLVNGPEIQFCKMKKEARWYQLHSISSLTHRRLPWWAQTTGFLIFIQSMRTRVVWGPKCTDMDTAGTGRGEGMSDLLEGLPALTWDQGMAHTGKAVKQLTHQEEQTTLHSLSCPRLGPGNPPGPEQGSRAQTFQNPSSVVSSVFFGHSLFASYKWLGSKCHMTLPGILAMGLESHWDGAPSGWW